MHDDLVRFHARDERSRKFPTGAHAKTCSLFRRPPCDRSGQQRPSRVDQASVLECRAEAPNPMTKVGLVDDVDRGAEFIGNLGQCPLTYTKATQLIEAGGQGPYRPGYSRRDGMAQRRHDLEAS